MWHLREKIVFCVLKQEAKVYTEIVPDCSKPTLQGIIRGHVEVSTVIHSDGWRVYDSLVDIGFDKHFRVNHGNNEFANGEHQINGIESFWSYAKRRLAKFNGVAKHTFYLHLKERDITFTLGLTFKQPFLSCLRRVRNTDYATIN